MDITFRKMQESDLEFFNDVRNLSIEFLHTKVKFSLEQVKEWFKKTDNIYYIVTVNDIDIGYFRTSEWGDDSCYIGMDIHPNFRGNGYAQESYPIFMEYLHFSKGINTLYLEVLPTNERAIHIYKKLGFGVISKDESNIKMQLNYDNKKL